MLDLANLEIDLDLALQHVKEVKVEVGVVHLNNITGVETLQMCVGHLHEEAANDR